MQAARTTAPPESRPCVGTDGIAQNGDLAVIGSSIKAQNVTLDAARDLTLQSAHNRSDTTGSNSSSGAAIGVSVGVGSGKAGVSVFANANRASGKENGDTDSYTETNITAGQTLTLNSGRDTTLTGALASGDTIAAKVGRNLTLSSQQDQDHYASQQRSASVGGSVAVVGNGGGVNASLSRQRIDSQYQSVAEQSGLYAGQGGFNVQVGGHTQLNGAVIASSASPEHNQLSTATLGWQDLQNRAEYRVESQSIGASSNLAANALGNASTVLGGGHTQGSTSSTTLAPISAGSLTVRDSAAQQQDIATLRRDATGTANGLSPLFNKQAELDRLQAIQLIGDIGQQTLQIANTHKRAELDAAVEWAKADPLYANSADYRQLQATWGKGGSVQQAVTAVTAALQGLAGGDTSAAVAGAAAPYLATQIKQLTTDPATGQVNTAANAMAHALLGATIAAAKGDNAVAGAAGAGSAPLIAATLAQNLYGSDAANLTESQKDTVAALTTLAGSLAGGIAGGNAASALAGGLGAKNEVENNWLRPQEIELKKKAERQCADGNNNACTVVQLLRKLDTQREQANDGTRYKGMTQALTELLMSPVTAPVELIASIDRYGLSATANALAEGLAGLPARLIDGLQSDNPEVQGRALTELLASGVGGAKVIGEIKKATVALAVSRQSLAMELAAGQLPGGLKTVASMSEALSGQPAKATAGGYINATKVCEAGCAITGLSNSEQALVVKIQTGQDFGGQLTEQLLASVATRTGSIVLPGGKYGANKDFDLVLQNANGTVTVVMDGKQMSQAGAFSLSANAAGGNTQNSMAWIDAVLDSLDKGSAAYKAVEAARRNNTLVTAVGGVNRTTGELVVLPVTVPTK